MTADRPDLTPLLRRRLHAALLACLGPIFLFALADLRLLRQQLELVYAIKLLAVVIVLAAVYALRAPRGRSVVVTVALSTAAGLYALSTTSAIIASEPLTTPLLSISIALVTGTLLPWGVRPQLVLVGLAALATITTTVVVTGDPWQVVQYPNIGVAIALGASIYVAHELERSRREVELRQMERQRAEAEVRQLNEVLEKRVTDRTAALARVNEELQNEIARRARTEAELRQSQAALSALVETTAAAIWSVDRSLRLTASNSVANAAFARRFGGSITASDATVPEPVLTYWRQLYQRAFAGERFSTEHDYALGATTVYLLTSFAPIVTDGVVTGVSVFSSDISERKRADAAARAHQAELTHVLRMNTMNEMAAGLAHEINQPLGAIANYATGCGLRLRAGGVDHADMIRILELIAGEALRAGTIIRRLRSLIRKEDSRHDWTDLNELATDAVSLLAADMREHAIATHLDLSTDLPRIHVDSIQIEQVLLNLLRNAIDALLDVPPARRELRVTTALVGEALVEISIADRGGGLHPGIVDTLFDPFVSTKSKGLGMGLSISRTIIDTHGGRLWASAHPDGGAIFHVRVPVQMSAQSSGDGQGYRQSA